MVGLKGRFRKLKSPVVRGSREGESDLSQTPATAQNFRPPVLRNFSYPINVGIAIQPPTFPSGPSAEQTQWDHLGEICSFSPDSVSRTGQAKTTDVGNPFFFKSESESYTHLDDESQEFSIGVSSDFLRNRESQSLEELKARKKQRRSTLLGLPTSKAQTSSHKATKLSKGQSLGDRIFPQNPVTSRLKRNSLGQHKANASFGTSRFLGLSSGSSDRPASSSGVPLIDTKLKPSSPTGVSPFPSPLIQGDTRDFSADSECSFVSQKRSAVTSLETDLPYNNKASYNYHHGSGSISESLKSKGDDYKPRWLSQLKGWVSVSEPSTQVPEQCKEANKKANIALDKPQANDKLHFPDGTLPRHDSILAGPGLCLEDKVMKEAEQIRQARTRQERVFQGSGSGSNRYSYSSSIVFDTTKKDS
ncbi:hypothetical protein Hte_000892 [Hypoxylon texense]